ncbi:hypothetical protein MNB_SV-10-970 [hydrothermal vent metagenome]|uniref:Uncharacterized protein n=1 Tax=hydrothermal vent metagenome TaxID=652676 RepID=A0A1W1BY87_9ZZZZ
MLIEKKQKVINMKEKMMISAILLFGTTLAEASVAEQEGMFVWPVVLSAALIILFLTYLVISYKNRIKHQNTLLEEKDEKIKWFREVSAKNEYNRTQKEHELEKQIVELNHTIEILEKKAKEGTKNQVVAKLEAQQNKRARLLERAGMTV